PEQVSLIMLAFGAGWAVSQPVGGWVADRSGRRIVLVISAFGSAGAYLFFGAATEFVWLAVSAASVGLTFDLYRPALSALISDSVHADQRPDALSLLYLIMNVSRGVACVLGGLLAAQNFWLLFAVNAGLNIAFGVVVWRTVPANRQAAPAGPAPKLTMALRDPQLVWFTVLTLSFFVIHMQSVVSLPVVIDQSGVSPLVFGLILGVDPLVVTVTQLLFQRQLMRCPPLVTCAAGVTAVGVGLAVTAAGTSAAWFAATTPLWVAGEICFLAVAPGVVARLAPEHLRAVYFGVWGLAQGFSAVLAPLMASAALALGGSRLLWTIGAVLGGVTGFGCLALRRSARFTTSRGRSLAVTEPTRTVLLRRPVDGPPDLGELPRPQPSGKFLDLHRPINRKPGPVSADRGRADIPRGNHYERQRSESTRSSRP
ncbi:MAG TPA: MFS transporter, partial [Candidatus Limnocylindrales bacterium]|nr:MFS transporter [Candidatus Limnocylindrales bacterium]